jgi:hypothetical protein
MVNDPVDLVVNHYWGSDPGDAMAAAIWEYTITINGTPGSSVQMLFSFILDGLLSTSSHALANAYIDWSAYDQTTSGSTSDSWTYSTISAYGPQIPSSPISGQSLTVSAGDTVAIYLRLRAYASVGCSALSSSMLCTANSTADLSNTLSFNSITFTDGQGDPTPGFSITSLSGFDYNQFNSASGPAVPEPLHCITSLSAIGGLVVDAPAVRLEAGLSVEAGRRSGPASR